MRASRQLDALVQALGFKQLRPFQLDAIKEISSLVLNTHQNRSTRSTRSPSDSDSQPVRGPRVRLPGLPQPAVCLNQPTGSGKTVAFMLPTLLTAVSSSSYVSAVVLCPTPELAVQHFDTFQTTASVLDPKLRLSVITDAMTPPAISEQLTTDPHVIIATPHSLLQSIQKARENETTLVVPSIETDLAGLVSPEHVERFGSQLRLIVLDEPDRLLTLPGRYRRAPVRAKDFPAISCVNFLLAASNSRASLVLSSASLNSLTRKFVLQQTWASELRVVRDSALPESPDVSGVAQNVSIPASIAHQSVDVPKGKNPMAELAQEIVRVYLASGRRPTLLLVKSAADVSVLGEQLTRIHGTHGVHWLPFNVALFSQRNGLSLGKAFVQMRNLFRTGEVGMLISDFGSIQGIDFPWLENVFIAAVPANANQYAHLAGRTGRAEHSGTVTTFILGEHPGDKLRYNSMMKRLRVDPKSV